MGTKILDVVVDQPYELFHQLTHGAVLYELTGGHSLGMLTRPQGRVSPNVPV